jgi:hypothetical protein
MAGGTYGLTVKTGELDSVWAGMETWTVPVVAPAGTVVVIAVPVGLTVKLAGVPLNVASYAPVSMVPRMVTAAPTLPETPLEVVLYEAIGGLNQSVHGISALGSREFMHCAEGPRSSDREDRTKSGSASILGGSVQNLVTALNQRTRGVVSLGRVEGVERREYALRRYLEDGTGAGE